MAEMDRVLAIVRALDELLWHIEEPQIMLAGEGAHRPDDDQVVLDTGLPDLWDTSDRALETGKSPLRKRPAEVAKS